MPNVKDLPRLANDRVVVLAYDGLCTFEFGIVAEVFGLHRPEMGPAWYRFASCAIDKGPLRAHAQQRRLIRVDQAPACAARSNLNSAMISSPRYFPFVQARSVRIRRYVAPRTARHAKMMMQAPMKPAIR